MSKNLQAEIEDIYPLSAMQRGMLFYSLSQPDSYAYLYQLTLHFEGEFDMAAFKWAWQEVLRRHSSLRVSFIWEDLETPLQVVHRTMALPWKVLDWRRLDESEQQRRLKVLLETDREEGIDLSVAPLFRLTLIQFPWQRRVLIFTTHHAQMDGWSQQIVFREVQELYKLWQTGNALSHPPAPQFREYIQWLQRYDLHAAEAFWRNELRGFVGATPLSLGGKGAGKPETRNPVATEESYLSAERTAALRRTLQQRHFTLNTLLRAAWGYVLSRYSGESDVVFGATVSGRPPELQGIDRMVGLFINTIPVRLQMEESMLVNDWLARLQKQQAEQGPYEYAPTAQIHQWSEIDRSSPLFETILVVENFAASGPGKDASWQITRVDSLERTHYPITVIVGLGERLHFTVPYDDSRFSPVAVTRLLAHLGCVLEQMCAAENLRIADLQLLSPAEMNQVVYEFNSTSTNDNGGCVHTLVEEQVRRSPEATAVKFGPKEVSYAELDNMAQRLACRLIRAGTGPEVLVAICLERSIELVVSLLAILKSGAAYVPLDPEWPAERRNWILEDSSPAVLLTQTGFASLFPDPHLQMLFVDNEHGESLESRSSMPEVCGKNAVYVIYTSGSTGRPKGVVNTHEGVVNRLRWMRREYSSSRPERVLQKTPYTFDVSVWEFFWPLINGGCVVVARPGGHRDPGYLLSLIDEEQVTTVHFVTSMLRAFLDAEEHPEHQCRSLERVICSGEELTRDVAEKFFRKLKGVELHDLYGPTEASIDVTKWKCNAKHIALTGTVPIGKPIQNCAAFVLGPNLQPLPRGVTGNLYISGIQLARGYCGQTALTAESFIPSPFSQIPGHRLYRTGDLARWDEGGNLEYRGRKDSQVKVRGYRVELGEIEVALEGIAGVRQAAVVVEEGGGAGERKLVGYVMRAREDKGERRVEEELREELKKRLPEYMVPALVRVVKEMPLTGSGKIDRKELARRWREEREAGGEGTESPGWSGVRNEVEEEIAKVWREVLGVERVGVGQNFFDLGGDSLSLLQVHGKLRGRWPRELTVTDLFRYPTIASLASTLSARGSTPQPAKNVDQLERKVKQGQARMKQRLETRLGNRG